jgi:hypothetical protein
MDALERPDFPSALGASMQDLMHGDWLPRV